MAYKIEDIDWSKIPEDAVEFSLEDDEFIFCWFNKKGEFTDLCGTMAWEVFGDAPEDKEDIRERHKVSDYYPSPTNLTMSDADKVEHFLKELSELSNKYKIEIGGCGCCGSPSLHTEDFVEGGCYTVNKDNDFLEYS